MHILDRIVEKKKQQLILEKKEKSQSEIIKEIENINVRDFTGSLRNPKNLAIIAEIKKASPSKGIISEDFDVRKTAEIYENSNVQAVSILTERNYFLGENCYINKAKEVLSKPVLRKDFIIDKYQIYQTKAIGGDGILLIASVLREKLFEFYKESKAIGLHPLVEIHSKEDINYIEKADPEIIGVNNRDLENFETDIKHTEIIKQYLPKNKIIISESGIRNIDDLKYLKSIGVKGALIGEYFMRNLEVLKELENID